MILYYIPEVTEEELTAHVTKAENWLHAVLTRRESRVSNTHTHTYTHTKASRCLGRSRVPGQARGPVH